MGYDLTLKQGLNFGKGWRNLLHSFASRGKNLNYYHITHWELDYITLSMPLEAQLKQPISPKDGEDTIDLDSDIST